MRFTAGRWRWAPLSMGFAAGTVVALGTLKVIAIARIAFPTGMRVGLETASFLLLVSILVLCVAAVCLIREGMEPTRESARLARRVLEANAPSRAGVAFRQPGGEWGAPPPASAPPAVAAPRRAGRPEPELRVEHGSRLTAGPMPGLERNPFARRTDNDDQESAGLGADGATALASWPERLTGVWHTYLESGDGRFTAEGLSRQLRAAGVDGKVVTDHCFGEAVLGVDLDDGNVYLLPHFDSTPEELADWFQARSGAPMRLSRIQRLVQVAVAVRGFDGSLELRRKGAVE